MEQVFTLVLTDLVDSTSLNARLGDVEMRVLWDLHDSGSRRLLREWRGREIDRSDGFLALFEDTTDAGSFVAAYHQMLGAMPVKMKARAGVHVGPLDIRRNASADVFLGAKPVEVVGLGKAFCARLMFLASGGQTLASPAAALALTLGGFACRSHGHWRLKGIDDPIEISEVGHDDAPFIPPSDHEKAHRVVLAAGQWVGLGNVPRHLPAEGDRFFGRRSDLLAVAQLAASAHRLITVLGTGGIGKTRLALRYAWGWLGDYPGGVYFCDLAAARNADGIASAVARALEVPIGAEPLAQLGAAIAGRGTCLLVLDNFEQVAACAAGTVGLWLGAAANARFLVTSRERLGLPGEHVLALRPLDEESAVDLFNERAQAAHAGYLPEHSGAVMLPLVKLLDRLPLAIELAAARSPVATPSGLLKLMTDRFRLLASHGGRPDRQATLRGTLEWSWDLLTLAERCALAQLSVFEGSFSLLAAQTTLELSSVAGDVWIVEVLQRLVDRSLLRPYANGRFGLLQCIREFSAEKLGDDTGFPGSGSELAADTVRRHRRYFAKLDEAEVVGGGCVEVDNLVAACRGAGAVGDTDDAVACLRLAWVALRLVGPFQTAIDLAGAVKQGCLSPGEEATVQWVQGAALYACGNAADARAVIVQGLAVAPTDSDPKLLARLHCCLGEVCSVQGEAAEAERHLELAWQFAQRCTDLSIQCQVLNARGALASDEDRMDDARRHYAQALDLAELAGDTRWQAGVLGNLGVLLMAARKYDQALEANRRALEHALSSGDLRWAGNAHCNLGLIHTQENRLDDADWHLSEALTIAQRLGHRALEFTTLCNLGLVCEKRLDMVKACEHHRAAVEGAARLGDVRIEAQLRSCLGSALARSGQYEEARRCLQVARELLARTSDKFSRGLVLCSTAENEFLDHQFSNSAGALHEARTMLADCGNDADSELGRRLAEVQSLIGADLIRG